MDNSQIYKIIPTENPIPPAELSTKLQEKLQLLPNPEIFNALDAGQVEAVLSENPRTLVLAGAGAGKTKVLVHRILHLIKNKNIPSGKILAMTFSREATKEMRDRLKEVANDTDLTYHPELHSLTISTIHALCYHILKTDGAKVYNTNFKVVGDEHNFGTINQNHIIHLVLAELSNDKEFLNMAKQFIIDYLIDYSIFTNEKPKKGRYITLDGISVRSKSERDIANFLVQQNIRYEYEKPAEWADTDEGKPYRPDFYLPDFDCYIEHWLISDKNEELSPLMKHVDKQKYLKEKEWKLNQFVKHRKKLIQSHEHQMRGRLSDYFIYLNNELKIKSNNSLINSLSDQPATIPPLQKGFSILITSLANIINLAKANKIKTPTIKENLKNEKHEEILHFYELFTPVYEYYNNYLTKKSLLDFNDMINKTIELLEQHPEICKKYQKKYKHICIDEYQDISESQIELFKLFLSENNTLFAVGDDWQSIYGFRGAEVSYILDFKKQFKNAEQIILPYNYRSSKNIVDASTIVIHKGKNIIAKKIKSRSENKNEKIFQYNALNEADGAQFIINTVKKLIEQGYKTSDFFLLYRRSRHIYPYKIYFEKYQFDIPLKTIHSAKGQEAKVVFIVGLTATSFPYVWEDPRIIQIIKKTELRKKDEEERRIFYVAMTRAKEKLFLISEKYNESEFCSDIPTIFKKVEISEKQLTEEMLSPKIKEVFSLIKRGKLVSEIAEMKESNISTIESYVSLLIRHGLLDVKNFVADEVYKMIAFYIPENISQPRLNQIKKKLPEGISYGQIRWVIADLKKKDKI